jgi:hypothetical protein
MADDLNLAGLTKLVTVLAALAYAKPKLLLTGILILFSLLLLASHLFFLAWSLASCHGQAERELPSLKWIVLWALFFLLLLVGASALLCFQSDAGLGQITVRQARESINASPHLFRLRATLRVASEVYLPILIAALFVYVATRIYDRCKLKADRLKGSLEQFYFLVAVAAVAISAIGYVYMFTRTFYPAIPQEFGGGKPYFESLAIEESERCKLQQIGIPFEEKQPEITKPLPVLHETDSLLAVWLRCPSKANCNGQGDGQGESHYIVVQIGKGAITSTRAYADGVDDATVVPYVAPCKIGVASNSDASDP